MILTILFCCCFRTPELLDSLIVGSVAFQLSFTLFFCLSSFCLDIHCYHLLLCFSSSCTLLFSLLLLLLFQFFQYYFRTALCHSYSHACQKILNGPSCFIIGLLFFPPSEFVGVLLVYEVFLIFLERILGSLGGGLLNAMFKLSPHLFKWICFEFSCTTHVQVRACMHACL